MNILVINAGSSSLKYQLLDPETGRLLAKGSRVRVLVIPTNEELMITMDTAELAKTL